MKNQLYQLQHDVEEAEYDKGDEMDQLEDALDGAEKQIDNLKNDNENLKNKLKLNVTENNRMEKVIHQLEDERSEMETFINDLEAQVKPPRESAASNQEKPVVLPIQPLVLCTDSSEYVTSPLPSPTRSKFGAPDPMNLSFTDSLDSKEVLQNWKQLEEAQKKLTKTQEHLFETQSSLATLAHKYKAAVKVHEDEFSNAKKIARNEWKQEWKVEMEKAVELQIVGTKQSHEREMEKLRDMNRARDDTIGNLQHKVENFNIEMTSLEAELDRIRHDKDCNESKIEGDGKKYRCAHSRDSKSKSYEQRR